MSQIKELYEKVSKDAILQEKVTQIMKDAEQTGQDATEAKLVEFAKNVGYDISISEMQEFFQSLTAKKDGELSDLELDMVAGGKAGTGFIVMSVLTFGIMCAAVSIGGEISSGGGCERLGNM